MTVEYSKDVARAVDIGLSWKLLARWRGSIYKLLWKEVVLYVLTYVFLGLLYKFLLNEEQKGIFELISRYCARYVDSIPVMLMLGFFTAVVMQRWWSTYTSIPGTSKLIVLACCVFKNNNEESVRTVRTLARFILVSWVLCMRTVCQPLWRKFPTLKTIQENGLLLEHELKLLEKESSLEISNSLSIIPVIWSTLLIEKARREKYLHSDADGLKLLEALMAFKKSCSTLLKYYYTNVPLVVIQAVTLSVHTYGLANIMGRQFVDLQSNTLVIEMYMPIFPMIQTCLFVVHCLFVMVEAGRSTY